MSRPALVTFADGKPRCGWLGEDPLYVDYHDREWGVPLRDDRALFELLILEGCQAGLSWITVLRKRENYRRAYDGFDPRKIARYGAARQAKLMADEGLVRNRAKIAASVQNAQAYLRIVEREGGFAPWIWQFVGGVPLVRSPRSLKEIPGQTAQSQAMSKALRGAGFNFVGPTICYAFMQAAGMVDDHVVGCHRHGKAAARNKSSRAKVAR
ncbi:MAG: DNA-3-methyladenine glycosylase I [Reyranellaceae bacterium]